MRFSSLWKFALKLFYVLSVAIAYPCAAQQMTTDPESIATASNMLIDGLRKAAGAGRIDLDHQHVDLAFAFCTSHFRSDPVPAIAARALATKTVEDLLIDGDRVYGFAWELGVWDHSPAKDKSILVSRASQSEIVKCASLWPLASQSGSRGGHDTEKAISDLAKQVANPNSTIIVLIGNENQAATVVPEGYRAVGENDQDYQAVLHRWNRVGAKNKSGASMEVDYVARSDRGKEQRRHLDIIVLIPAHWESRQLTGESRLTVIGRPIQWDTSIVKDGSQPKNGSTSQPPRQQYGGGGVTLQSILAVCGIILLVALVVGGAKIAEWLGKPIFMRLENRSFNLEAGPKSQRLSRSVQRN